MYWDLQIRIFFRLIEFSGGKTSSNPLPFHEIYFYALEAVPMCLAILCFNITHPGTLLRGPEAQLPSVRSINFRRKRKEVVVSEVEGEAVRYELLSKI